MLCIKNVSARNFMSIGNNVQAVNFDGCQLTLVLGNNLDLGGDGSRNGTGKTTIINALSFALYGVALTSIKKDNLINKTNGKGMIVTVEFSIDGVEYRIERGRRPAVLRFFVDGIDLNSQEQQGENRETQKEIEKVIGFPHNMFKHLIALNTYSEPFLSMRAADQRDMIEQLLGITDLSLKAEVLKELMKAGKDAIKEEELRISAVTESNNRINKNIEELERRSRVWERSKEEKLNEFTSAIELLEKIDIEAEVGVHRVANLVKEANTKVKATNKELDQILASRLRSEKSLEKLENDLTDAKAGQCPACGQDTAHLDTHEAYTIEIKEKIAEEIEYRDDLVSQQTALEEKLKGYEAGAGDIPKTFYDSMEDALEHKHNLDKVCGQFGDKYAETNTYEDQIQVLKDTGIQEIDFDLMNKLTDDKDHQDCLYKLLTDKGSFIRKRIIDQNIAYLNHRLAYYLEKLGLPHEVKFSNELTVEITEYGRDLDFDNLSRGERNRLILGLSWSFRDLYESLNRPMNLMCIDELIDSGMDSSGVENALAILKKMNRDQGKNILLVSHKEELIGRVNNVLTVVKTGGFTEYNTDVEYVE